MVGLCPIVEDAARAAGCRAERKKKKKKRNGSAAARQVCWGGFLLVPAFLQTGEMAGDTASLSAVGLVGAEGWIAGYK